MESKRNYGIDALRLVLMYMVCMLHTLGQGGVLSASAKGSLGYYVFWLLEIFSYCAVDGFAIISGYTAVDRPRKYEKIVDMWFQAFFYSFVVTAIFTVIGVNADWGIKDMIKCALPVTFEKFWYFTAFFALFFAIPALNKFVFSLDEKAARKALFILVVLFSGVGLLANAFKTQWGYSALWLMVLYCIGALAKKAKLFENKSTILLIFAWGGSALVTWLVHTFVGTDRLTSYVSPTILLNGLIMVVLFSRIKLKGNIISKISPLAFGIYLFQLNQVIWNHYLKGAFSFVVQHSVFIGILYVLAFATLIFVSGLAAEFARTKIAKLIKLPMLSKKIANLAGTVFEKICSIQIWK